MPWLPPPLRATRDEIYDTVILNRPDGPKDVVPLFLFGASLDGMASSARVSTGRQGPPFFFFPLRPLWGPSHNMNMCPRRA